MNQEKRPPGVMLYFDKVRPLLALMTDEEAGQFLRAVLDYGENGVEPVLSDRLAPSWVFMKRLIDSDAEAYRKKCEKASKAIKSRWEKERGKG